LRCCENILTYIKSFACKKICAFYMRTPAEDTGVRAPVRIPVVAENTPIKYPRNERVTEFFCKKKKTIRYIELTFI